ncbi:MAG: hypothetical protein ACTSU7_07890 [Candidatus Heimdallarchaeaceae archaeon]
MNKRIRRAIITTFLFTGIISLSFVSLASAKTVITSSNSKYADLLQVRLFDGDYGDFDEDGNEDDVECYIEVSYLVEVRRKKYDCYIQLLLPNGESFEYGFWVLTTYPVVTLQLVFLNHATTSGDYTVIAEVLFHFPGCYYYDASTIIFDPPTERIPDSEPTFEVRF